MRDEWLSPQDLAAQLKVSVDTVYKWNVTGAGPSRTRVGRHVRYRRSDVEVWLRSQEVSSGPTAA